LNFKALLIMQEKDIYTELSSIRNLMERSTKFISLSGLSGVMAGIYALIGAFIGYNLAYSDSGDLDYRTHDVNDPGILSQLFLVAIIVLFLSLSTGMWLTIRQARKKGEHFWNPVSRRLIVNLSVPLLTGGMFILILLWHGQYGIIAPACLIFYGLALISGSQFTFSDVKWLGYCEIILGLMAALFPGYGMVFWVIGFGLLHILYGTIMHFKYNQ
jgi:MFS family permease